MEDVIYIALMVAVMIGGAISSANKKKKEAARKAAQLDKEKERGLVRKSLSEVLQEFENRENPPVSRIPEPEDFEEDYYEEEMASLDEQETAAARLEAMTFKPMAEDSVEWRRKPIQESPAVMELEEPENAEVPFEFELKRAIIEAEILKPKYEQY